MKKELQKFHLDTLQMHQAILYETLIFSYNIITEGVKSITFENNEGAELKSMRGYFAMKDVDGIKKKYFIEEKFYNYLPLRANGCEEVFFKDSTRSKSIVLRPIDPTPFKIVPKKIWGNTHEFIDMLLPFEHTNPDHWTLHKIVAIMGYVGKVFIGDCSRSEFGKSSIYEVLHSLTKKSPVFQPRSVPGVLAQITGDGNMIFDEVSDTNSETKRCMENFTLQVGGNKSVYINGALQSKNTKSKYDVGEQSITYLYNTIEQYKTDENFFDNMFSNNCAIDSRLLKLKFDGVLTEKFDKDFNMVAVAESNKLFYIDIAKQLLFLKELKRTNNYKRRYSYHQVPRISGRKKRIYDELTWLIDMYAQDEKEYIKFIDLLNSCVNAYRKMVGNSGYQLIEEEVIEGSDEEKILSILKTNKTMSAEAIELIYPDMDVDSVIKKLKDDQEIFESQRGKWSVLE